MKANRKTTTRRGALPAEISPVLAGLLHDWEAATAEESAAASPDAAEGAVMAAEDDLIKYQPKSWEELAAKARTIDGSFVTEEEGSALLRDIQALAAGGGNV